MKGSNLVAAAVLGACLILAAATFALVGAMLGGADEAGGAAALARLQSRIDDQARDIAALDQRVRDLAAARENAPPPPAAPVETPAVAAIDQGGLDQFGGAAPPPETEGLIDQMRLAADRFNQGIERPRPQVLLELLGNPRESYGQDCQPVTNARMLAALETREIAGFKLTMMRPALDSLRGVMDRLHKEEPDIYAAIGTAGALCARYVRGSRGSISSHAWGLAVDLTLKQNLDKMGDGSTQFGLVVLAEFFNDAGWYWGAGYGREDSMHFEVGEALLRQWIAEGKL